MTYGEKSRFSDKSHLVLFICIFVIFLFSTYSKVVFLEGSPLLDNQKILIEDVMSAGQGYAFVGESAGDWAGLHVYSVGDINNDNYDDFVIGATQEEGGTGKAYLILGRHDSKWTNLDLSNANASFIGEFPGDKAGRWIARAGDVNGDDFDDFAISATGYNNGTGKTYLFFGGSTKNWRTDISIAQANASFIGEGKDDSSGHGIYGVGDVNNDGYNDLLISGEWNDEGGPFTGQVYLILGRPTNQWTKDVLLNQVANASYIGNITAWQLGFDAAGIGDVNNDNYDDFLIGALTATDPLTPQEKNFRHVFLIFGRATDLWEMDRPISEANTSFRFEEWWPLARPSDDWISGVGDVNNDGYDDFVVGGYMDDEAGTDAGQTYLFLGRPTNQWTLKTSTLPANASFLGNNAGDWAGWSVAGLGDINNDDYDDFIIGAVDVFKTDNEGQVYIILGRQTNQWSMDLSLTEADYSYIGENKGDTFGGHAAGVGDVNNDGLSDFTISAIHNGEGGTKAGKIYLILNTSIMEPVTTTTTTSTTTENGDGSFFMNPISLTLGFVIIILIRGYKKPP